MKTSKGAFNVLTAVNVFLVLASCGSLVCKGDERPGDCAELIQDGSFETPDLGSSPPVRAYQGFSNPAASGTFPTLGGQINGVWKISANSFVGLVPNNGLRQSPNFGVTQFFNTPDGKQSIFIGGKLTDGSDSIETNGAVTQTIATPLKAGKTYHLSFLQSSYCYTPDSGDWFAVPGEINVALVSSLGHNVLSQSYFTVPDESAWVQQAVDVTIPKGGTGTYTIKFTSLGIDTNGVTNFNPAGLTGANIDAVSLREK